MKLIWTDNALNRIEGIAEYIREDNPTASKRWKKEIYQKAQPLKKFPRMGRVVPELNQEKIREIIFGNYRLIYLIEKNRISILTVRHYKQLFKADWAEPN
ncbi:type II toxin-antitoxin system RelE/ParE family toxin [candidate division KSB1 bacterium]|nr:type II toxin-antitoxin system RelE/ParE family toxin [candidate division KSB1 bacterium]